MVDRFVDAESPSYVVLGLVDEPAHLTTAALGLGALAALLRRPLPPAFALAALAAAVLIDADHVPDAIFDSQILTAGTPRPYTHSVATVAVAALATAALRGRARLVAGGVATGVALHLLRDLATAPVALWWPLSSGGVTMPYAAYVVALVVFTALVAAGATRAATPRRPAGQDRE
nr:metal-dependent hydrolase [Motilibacter aurantiacus]